MTVHCQTGLLLWFPGGVKLLGGAGNGSIIPCTPSACCETLLEQKRKTWPGRGSTQGSSVVTAERSQRLMLPVWLLSVIVKTGESF